MAEGRTRRAVLVLALAAAGLPGRLRAQRPGAMPTIGILWHAGSAEEEAPFREPLLAGLAEHGYLPGRTILLDERYAALVPERFERNARELAAANPEVIVAVSIPSALAAQRATSVIPVVFVPPPDPVALGLVRSLSHPGGNLTGLSSMAIDLAAKRVQLLKEALPQLTRLALLVERYDRERILAETEGIAGRIGLAVKVFEAPTADRLAPAFAAIAEEGFGAVMIPQGGPMIFNQKRRVAELALAHRLASFAPSDVFTHDGALMSYGPSWPALFRRVGWYVDRILKGARPAELPVEQPTRLELAVNLRTAAALGLEIPATVLARADVLIE